MNKIRAVIDFFKSFEMHTACPICGQVYYIKTMPLHLSGHKPHDPDVVAWREGPPMTEGFTDRAAWDAIHWRFSDKGSVLDDAMIAWQRENQDRVKAAMEAEAAA